MGFSDLKDALRKIDGTLSDNRHYNRVKEKLPEYLQHQSVFGGHQPLTNETNLGYGPLAPDDSTPPPIPSNRPNSSSEGAPPIPQRQYSNRPPAPIPTQTFNPLMDSGGAPKVSNDDIFAQPINTTKPSEKYKTINHPQQPIGCDISPTSQPIQTNNFYNNLALDDQTFPVWTQPYSLWFSKDAGQDLGMAFNHTSASQRVFGPEPQANPAQFYFNPPRIKSLVVSGEGLTESNTRLCLLEHQKLSVHAKLMVDNNPNKSITFPLTQGMGFVSAIYNNIRPGIASQVGVQHFQRVGQFGSVVKYKIQLFDQIVWSMYINGDPSVEFYLADGRLVANKVCNNLLVQFCKGDSKCYDDAAGCYADSCHLTGRVSSSDGKKCQYSFQYIIKGQSKSQNTIIWCLPHHQEVLIDEVAHRFTGLQLDSTTKGTMKAYMTNQLIMEEYDLPTEINWEPWSRVSTFNGKSSYSPNALNVIHEAAKHEVEHDVIGMANIDSMYTSGKILDKFAYILYVCHFILHDDDLTGKLYDKLTKTMDIFANNKQIFPLVYDGSWKGLVSSADPAADFGNANYNDHHFHYGYHIHAIALIAKVDASFRGGQWFKNSNAFDYATTMLRDVANPSTSDKFFPQFRSFDWFHGHSFAHGIFASGDGKDEESSSEDYHFAYGMKLYAKIIDDSAMEHRANLMLAIMKRSMNMYMLFTDDNKIQPKNFIKNKVAGISFENKLDFATYFGRGTIGNEWIHGIHMLPITPISSYIRLPKFVSEEWSQVLGPIVDQIPDGWKGILMLNLALFDPKTSWKWFSRNDWNDCLIDNGMSRTWSLAYISGIGGDDQ